MFENLTHNKAYFLGFFSADGCNQKKSLSIQIQKRDSYILEPFQKLFQEEGYNTNLNLNSRKIILSDSSIATYSRLRIYGKSLCDEVTSIGLPPNKSFTLKLPIIPDEFMPDYLRGLMDGDGTISVRRKYIEIEIYSASYSFLESIMDWLYKNSNISHKNLKRHNSVYRIQLYGNESLEFCNIIYNQNPNLYLKRKKEIFDNYSFQFNPKYWTSQEIEYLISNYKPGVRGLTSKIANELDRSYKSVSKQIWNLKLNN